MRFYNVKNSHISSIFCIEDNKKIKKQMTIAKIDKKSWTDKNIFAILNIKNTR